MTLAPIGGTGQERDPGDEAVRVAMLPLTVQNKTFPKGVEFIDGPLAMPGLAFIPAGHVWIVNTCTLLAETILHRRAFWIGLAVSQ